MSRYRTTMAEALRKVYETPEGFALVSKAKEIAKKFANNMSKAVAEIEKLEKGLSKNSSVRDALRKANEELEEGKMKDIFTADQEGESAAEIAKKLKLPLATVKKILGEATIEIKEFTSDMIKRLKKSYSTMPQKISTAQADALSRHLDRLDLVSLKQLAKEKIPFITTLARNKVYRKTGKFEEFLKEEDHEISMARGELEAIADKATKLSGALQGKSEAEGLEAWVQSKITKAKDYINSVADYMEYTPDLGEDKEVPPIDKDNAPGVKIAKIRAMDKEDGKEKDKSKESIEALKDQIAMLKVKLENEKNKAVKPEPNPETGEVPLTIGLAHKLLRDKEKKEDVQEAKFRLEGEVDYKNKPNPEDFEMVVNAMNRNDAMKQAETNLSRGGKKINALEFSKVIKEMAKDDAYAIGMAQAKKSMNDEPPLEKKTIKKGHEIAKKVMKKEVKEEIRLRVESMAALKKKADKSGMPYSILKKVFDRGMAAWKGGHRPGASQHQWAYARVNSFTTKSSGTWGGADKDLAAKVRGSK